MDFSLILYETTSGTSPVQEFLDDIEKTDPEEHALIVEAMIRLKDSRFHRAPRTKALEGGLFELRHLGKLNTRVVWFFRSGRRIVAVHGIRTKAQKIFRTDMEIAKQRMMEWIRRNQDGQK